MKKLLKKLVAGLSASLVFFGSNVYAAEGFLTYNGINIGVIIGVVLIVLVLLLGYKMDSADKKDDESPDKKKDNSGSLDNLPESAFNLVGTIEFNNLNYQFVPNKSKVVVTDSENNVQKEYDVVVKGDVNGNGAITVTDVVMTAYYSLESIDLDNLEALAADENGNGKVTVTDVYLIAMKALEGGN